MPLKEKITQKDLILYEILKHPALCGQFIRNIDKTAHEEPFEYTQYQDEFACDFNDHVGYTCARAVGKTVVLVDLIIWVLINSIFPGDYINFHVPGKVHVEPVFTGLEKQFRGNSLLKHFIQRNKGINRSDLIIRPLTSSFLDCRIAGQTGTGASVVAAHSPFVIVDESGYYPWGTWVEMQPTVNTFTSGYRVIVAGVPTGLRENNVCYHVDRENSSFTKHNVTAYENPRFTEEDEQKAIETYGGKDNDDFIHLVLGKHGKPIFALFDRNSMQIGTKPVYKLTLDGIKLHSDIGEYFKALSVFPGLSSKKERCIFGIDLGYCYSEDTEVLTKRGWLRHNDITTEDLVACYDTKDDHLIWDNPIYVWEQEYKGEMLEISGKSTNFLVSPEHSVWISKAIVNTHQKYEKSKAKELLNLKNNRFKVKLTARNIHQTGVKTFKVPYYYCDRKDREKKNTEVDIRVWLEFLGWFISEGSATNSKDWSVSLTQQVGEYADKIDKMINKLPYTVSRKEFITPLGKKPQIEWRITCKELCLWLRENCGVHSENKKIPEFIFDCSTEDQELFLRTLLLGDGSRVNSNRSPQYNSQSEILVDQIQRLALFLGYSATKGYYEKGNMYRVSIMNRKENILYRDSSVKKIDYTGKIYCLKTNTGFYVTRRKGRVAIQGNTEPTAIIILVEDSTGRLNFHGRIRLNKVNYYIQEKIIDWLDTKFEPMIIGIDEGSAGKAVIPRLKEHEEFIHKDFAKKIIPINFSSNIVLGTDSEGNEIKSKTKPFSVGVLQNYTNNHKIVYSSTDLEMITELERMTYSKTPTGDIVYRTLTQTGGKKGEDHFTAALLCGALAYYLEVESLDFRARKKKLAKTQWFIGG